MHRIFSGNLVASEIVKDLEIEFNQRIIPGETFLIFDEIQACPRALASLRYFYEEIPELHVASAGSLLEFSLSENSFPVGRVEFLWLYPMSFREFLLAKNADLLIEKRPDINEMTPVSETINEKFQGCLKEYFIVGGMPEAVKTYVESNSFEESSRVHLSLIQSFLDDFPKYGSKVDKECLQHIYETVPRHLGQQIKYTSLCPDKRIETIKTALKVLERALIVSPVRAATASGLPLGADASDKRFKLVFVDIGLARQLAGISASDVLHEKDLLHSFRGGLAEQYVGQELLATREGSESQRLYYWVTEALGNAEVDYLIVDNGHIIPVEVKSGPAGKMKSLSQFLIKHPDCPKGLVFHGGNISNASKSRIHFFPLYTDLKKKSLS